MNRRTLVKIIQNAIYAETAYRIDEMAVHFVLDSLEDSGIRFNMEVPKTGRPELTYEQLSNVVINGGWS